MDEASNRYGQGNVEYPVLATYAEGGIIEVKIVFSTYHWVSRLRVLIVMLQSIFGPSRSRSSNDPRSLWLLVCSIYREIAWPPLVE